MGAAQIRIDQPTHPTVPVGQPGVARDDLVLGQPVVARNSNDMDVLRWVWALVDKPAGSAAALSSTTSPTVSFTPDVEGSYLLQLAVNDGLGGEVDLKIAAVRNSLGYRYPATGETLGSVNWPTNGDKGWGKDAEQILRGARAPQLFAGVMAENLPIAASTVKTVGGIGLPTSLAQIDDYGFVDLAAAAGGPPTINGFSFLSIMGGGKTIVGLNIDLESAACLAGDEWALVLGMADVGDVIVLRLKIV